ncbi:DNA ligase [Actinotalea ferrariae]|uniref:ATP-dependent DNA ligase n=1 Tax=Actinotalea ferrariae TaxID=1386098 RepID=UPI001ECBCA7E|nr:DNA ligase [Actinotalea ferrariae]MBX9244685.1 DNA ligase [Actinotalea ferrariae]
MLATRAPDPDRLPHGPEWAYEVKWDGVRVLADTRDGMLRLRARSGRDVTVTYPELAGLERVQGAVLDGEVVVMSGGIPSFEALAERMNVRDSSRAIRLASRVPATYIVFDVLMLYGVDVSRNPFSERRATLERLELPACAQLSPVYPDGDALWQVTREHGLEGVVAKRLTSTYQPGRRSSDWIKAAHRATRTAAVVGWRSEGYGRAGSAASSHRLGAVLLGARDADGRWRYLGKAGSGLAGRRGADLLRALMGLERDTPALDDDVPREDARGVTWCEPRVGVDVRYLQRMVGGRLRQPVVLALRTDADIDPWETP